MPTEASLLRLRAEVAADFEAAEHHHAKLTRALATDAWAPGDPELAVVALALHHYYSAVESLFERVAAFFEGLPSRTDRWHQDLLKQVSLVIDGVRPAVIREETAGPLRELLLFRHFLRHAYAAELDPVRLRTVAETAARAHPALSEDLAGFRRALTEAAG